MIQIFEIQSAQEMEQAFEIRRIVFVIGQQCAPDEEYDEYEKTCRHFLAKIQGIQAGTCRIRETSFGIKLERFAVLENFRGQNIGAALVENCLQKIQGTHEKVYLHAQEHALKFYEKFGFQAVGERFYEANIPHFKMILVVSS
jgi:predicted GNAT family N-acyltransferase